LRARDAVDLADGLRDLALERPLVGDLLLERGGAELLLVEQLEAGLRAAGEALRRERDLRLVGLALLDGQRRAVVAELVADALAVQRCGHLPGARRVQA